MGCANVVIEFYGVHGFLEDVDRDRQFWREIPCHCERRCRTCECDGGRETCVGAALSFAAGEGFVELMSEVEGFRYTDASEWRNRFLIALLKKGL
jgi:hypothetical protein